MDYIAIKNNQRINLLDIPVINFESLKAQLCATNLRPLNFFGQKWGEDVKIYAVLADDEKGEILISSSILDKHTKEYVCLTKENHQYHMFERELFEQFEIKPLNHPWLKPVRKNQDNYNFFEMEGEPMRSWTTFWP